MLGGRLVRGCGETRVAFSTSAAAGYKEALARRREVVQTFAAGLVVDDGSHRHFELDGLAFGPGAVAALAVPASLRFMFGVKTELDEGVLVLGGYHEHVAAAAAIAAARSAAGNVLLAAKSQAAVAAVAGLYQDASFIDEQLSDFLDADEPAQAAAVPELDHTGHLGEQRVILAPADVVAWFESGPSLAHNNRAARHQLPAENLYSQPLRVGIAPVLGTS
jgi:hypothetical protein